MKLFLPKSKSSGFTLIELLIVIAILGVLATAVLSAINPVEQINRGRDTGSQSDAEQLISAVQRFNANNGYYPWQTGAGDTANVCTGSGVGCTNFTRVFNGANPAAPGGASAGATGGWTVDNGNYNGSANVGAAGSNVLSVLGSSTGGAQELQNTFVTRLTGTTYRYLYVYNRGTAGDSTYVCFYPQSISFKQNAIKRWNGGSTCTPGTNCTCNGVPSDMSAVSATVCDNTTADAPNTMYCLP